MGAHLDALAATTRYAFPSGNSHVAQGSGHYVQNDRPGTVIDAIRRTVQTVGHNPADPLRRCFNEDDRVSDKTAAGSDVGYSAVLISAGIQT